ncbi:MAG: SDR family oxidoreductase [Armatimonadetes bacterium]|nr:SDR family oxidoreductase [Armatimonadota bacterium]
MGLLDGNVAVITGAASGIGKGTAVRFAKEGAKLALADIDYEPGEALANVINATGGEAFFMPCDVSDAAQVEAFVNAAHAKYGRIDTVFANAGINGVWSPVEEITPEEWDLTMNINLRGTFLTVKYAVPFLKQNEHGGSILITSSVNGNRTFSTVGASAYSSSKAAQVAFMKMIALELGRHKIRANAICPGAIHTNIGENTQQRHTDAIGIAVEMPKGSPALHGGQGEPDDVAAACVFLASELSRHVSGVEMYVDGGASLLR